jgi:MFS family permease
MGLRLSAKDLPFYYGWVIFGVTFLIYAFMYGLRYSIGVFFTPIQGEFHWTTSMTASAVTIFFWVYAFSAPFVGRLAERMGVRKTVLIGGVLLGGGGALVSTVTELWQLYLFWGVIAAAGAAALYVIPTMALSRFFLRKRGRAVGWSSVGVSLGQAAIIPLVAVAIRDYGWRPTMMGLGLVVFAVTSVIGYLFLRDAPESMGLHVDGEQPSTENEKASFGVDDLLTPDWEPGVVVGTMSFRFIAVSYFFAVGGIISILTFAVPHMIRIGIDPVKASGAFGVIGLMSGVGSFVFGYWRIDIIISRRIHPPSEPHPPLRLGRPLRADLRRLPGAVRRYRHGLFREPVRHHSVRIPDPRWGTGGRPVSPGGWMAR